jgi:hypothetical protein
MPTDVTPGRKPGLQQLLHREHPAVSGCFETGSAKVARVVGVG